MVVSRVLLVLCAGASVVVGAEPEWEREYEQVRKIALRDARVRAAFEAAEKKLEAKILEIDPALKPHLEARRLRPAEPVRQEPEKTAKPEKSGFFSIFRSKTAQEQPRAGGFQPADPGQSAALKHEVLPGETLTAIAARYEVSAEEIQKANGIKDPRRLRAGQVLVVPGGRQLGETERREWDRMWDETVRH
jgi:LysM repeat protein